MPDYIVRIPFKKMDQLEIMEELALKVDTAGGVWWGINVRKDRDLDVKIYGIKSESDIPQSIKDVSESIEEMP